MLLHRDSPSADAKQSGCLGSTRAAPRPSSNRPIQGGAAAHHHGEPDSRTDRRVLSRPAERSPPLSAWTVPTLAGNTNRCRRSPMNGSAEKHTHLALLPHVPAAGGSNLLRRVGPPELKPPGGPWPGHIGATRSACGGDGSSTQRHRAVPRVLRNLPLSIRVSLLEIRTRIVVSFGSYLVNSRITRGFVRLRKSRNRLDTYHEGAPGYLD